MGLKDDLSSDIVAIFSTRWSKRDGRVVPDLESLSLGNDAVTLDGTVLYADLADSTSMVNGNKPHFAAEIYKTFLRVAAKIVKANGGTITAYDGDRIMAVYLGDRRNSSAVATALMIKYAIGAIVEPAMREQYPSNNFSIRHVVGIDTSPLFVAKTGVVGSNDLVWVGRAANYAAKLSALPHTYSSYITTDVYRDIPDRLKLDSGKRNVWDSARWNNFDNNTIYRTNARKTFA